MLVWPESAVALPRRPERPRDPGRLRCTAEPVALVSDALETLLRDLANMPAGTDWGVVPPRWAPPRGSRAEDDGVRETSVEEKALESTGLAVSYEDGVSSLIANWCWCEYRGPAGCVASCGACECTLDGRAAGSAYIGTSPIDVL